MQVHRSIHDEFCDELVKVNFNNWYFKYIILIYAIFMAKPQKRLTRGGKKIAWSSLKLCKLTVCINKKWKKNSFGIHNKVHLPGELKMEIIKYKNDRLSNVIQQSSSFICSVLLNQFIFIFSMLLFIIIDNLTIVQIVLYKATSTNCLKFTFFLNFPLSNTFKTEAKLCYLICTKGYLFLTIHLIIIIKIFVG